MRHLRSETMASNRLLKELSTNWTLKYCRLSLPCLVLLDTGRYHDFSSRRTGAHNFAFAFVWHATQIHDMLAGATKHTN
jgi:hypothetical protein